VNVRRRLTFTEFIANEKLPTSRSGWPTPSCRMRGMPPTALLHLPGSDVTLVTSATPNSTFMAVAHTLKPVGHVRRLLVW
jgi:hypothetical protein